MFEIGRLFVTMMASDRGLTSALIRANALTGRLTRSLLMQEAVGRRALARLTRGYIMLTAAAAAAYSVISMGLYLFAVFAATATVAGVAAIGLASHANELNQRFKILFGETGPKVEASLRKMSATMNRGFWDLKDVSQGFMGLFKAMGFTEDAAAGMSVQMTRLTTDMASFNDISDEKVASNLKSALMGNSIAMKKYGVAVNATTVYQEMLKLGFKGTYREASEQLKIMARMNVIMRQTAHQQGDAARTADQFRNEAKGLWGSIKDAGVAIGTQLIPAVTLIVRWLHEWTDAWKTNAEGSNVWGKQVAANVADVIQWLDRLITMFSGTERAGVTAGLGIRTAWAYYTDSIKDFFSDTWAYIKFFFSSLVTLGNAAISDITTGMASYFEELWDYIASGGSDAIQVKFGHAFDLALKQLATASGPEFGKRSRGYEEIVHEWQAMMDDIDKKIAERRQKFKNRGADLEDPQFNKQDPDLRRIKRGLGKEDKPDLQNIQEVFKKRLTDVFKSDAQKEQIAQLKGIKDVQMAQLKEDGKQLEALNKIATNTRGMAAVGA